MMKKFISILMVAFAMTAMVACDKNDNGGNTDDGNGYSAEMFVGTWRVENMTVDGQNMTPDELLFIMNEDGTGVANNNGVTENNEFTWSVDGDKLTITPRGGDGFVYTVGSLTENECTFSGTTVPMTDMAGDVVVHLVRVR